MRVGNRGREVSEDTPRAPLGPGVPRPMRTARRRTATDLEAIVVGSKNRSSSLELPTMISSRRLAKELAELKGSGMPEGCALLRADDLETWVISIAVLGESLYAGQTFALRFRCVLSSLRASLRRRTAFLGSTLLTALKPSSSTRGGLSRPCTRTCIPMVIFARRY